MDAMYNTAGLLPQGSPAYLEFLRVYKESVVAGHIGCFFIDSDTKNPRKYGCSGSSLFFPLDNKFSLPAWFSWCAYFSEQRSSAFQQATLWDEFIKELNLP
jgi:hypothetical protein